MFMIAPAGGQRQEKEKGLALRPHPVVFVL
jgi:hypothetical protein